MRVAGLMLMVSGWGIVLAAVALLPSATSRGAFVLCGLGVEMLGFAFCLRHAAGDEGRRP